MMFHCISPGVRRASSGFSLTELLITLAVVGIVAAYGAPHLREIVANNRQTAVINRFVASVLLARSLAITRGTTAAVCPSADGATCDEEHDWNLGWIVIHTNSSGGSPDLALGRVVRQEHGENGTDLLANRHVFLFRPRGRRATNGTVTVCHANATTPKAVIVSYNGRPRTARVMANGAPLVCP